MKKTLDAYQARAGEFRLVDVPDLQYLMVDGHGDPNTSPAFARRSRRSTRWRTRLKFASKRELGRDYVVPPLEGLWWAEDMDAFTAARDKSRWDWTLMMMVPDWMGREMRRRRCGAGRREGPGPAGRLRLETLSEGRCVQTLHVGSFDDEAGVLARCTTSSSRTTGCAWPARTTRSTSATSAGSRPRSGAPSCAAGGHRVGGPPLYLT